MIDPDLTPLEDIDLEEPEVKPAPKAVDPYPCPDNWDQKEWDKHDIGFKKNYIYVIANTKRIIGEQK